MQMETLHAEDPMAAYMMKQREKTQTKAGIKTKPKYKGPWPANRYACPCMLGTPHACLVLPCPCSN